MELITKDLLINFLFVLLPLFLMQMFYLLKYSYRFERFKDTWFVIFLLISLAMCMFFPFSFGNGFTWDLRRVPLLLGFLYAGPKNGFLLLAALFLIRYFVGGSGFYVTLWSYAAMAVLAALVSKYYIKMPLKQKLLSSVLLVFISLLLTYFAAIKVSDIHLTPNMWIVYFLLNIVSMWIATAIWEVIKTNLDVLQKLIKAEKLDIVSNLAASISHEVRNPLTASRGFMQLSHESSISPEIKEYIRLSIQELDRATDIINDYLTFAKPTPEKMEKILVHQEIYQVVNILTPLANMNSVNIKLSFKENESFYVLGERKKLEQALINIMKNGIEAMESGGEMSIQIEYEVRRLFINISDTGKGMTQMQIDRLGEPYFTTKEKGTGLGLMVSFSIIQSMDGSITVRSEIDKGTCFSIVLPAISTEMS
ncbi:ATP-binding protein [Domibacillus indicus]|uniref:ATP-binding protein n=1 Tax=Domibacillus indicus TaxID=1437523 RepID=UPI00203C9F62|nr:ATP-binding protein [Domibacillus indicus]MCM3791074.1 ATP-binding protein [Domibacillus indicus]